MNLVKELQNLINEHGSASILRERLALFKDKVSELEEKCRYLQKTLADSQVEIAGLRKQVKEKSVVEEFTEHMGALFKRKTPGGDYHPTVYCPGCRMPLGSMEKFFPYACDRCKVELDFNGHDLPRILKELNKS